LTKINLITHTRGGLYANYKKHIIAILISRCLCVWAIIKIWNGPEQK